MKKFLKWLIDHIELSDMLTPFSLRNFKKYTDDKGIFFVGITEVYLFGFRIARIQRTLPWD